LRVSILSPAQIPAVEQLECVRRRLVAHLADRKVLTPR